MKPKLAVCMPSRGMVMSRTMESVVREMSSVAEKVQLRLFMTHDLPLPDCFNELTTKALAWGADFIWFVEEDMALPQGILLEMAAYDEAIVTADYPVTGMNHTAIDYGEITMTGSGCLLVDREVFEKLGTPYFETKAYDLKTWEEIPSYNMTWGGNDSDFAVRVAKLGYKVRITPTKVGQYKLRQMGEFQNNDGCHQIDEWWF